MKLTILTVVILVLILSLRFLFYFQNIEKVIPGDLFKTTTTLLSDPQDSLGKQIFYIKNIRVEAPYFPKISYGDKLRVEGVIEEYVFTPVESDNEIHQLVIKKPQIIFLPQNNIFISQAVFLRSRVYENFNKVLPGNEAALLFGIVFGGSSGFSKEMKDSFRNTGVLHVVAASGMNVSMVGAFLLSFFSLFVKRRVALILALVGISYYALISGFEPSIIRASIMIGLAFTAGVLGRQNYAYFTLFLTAWIMMILSPGVIFEIGFLLSFTSTLGIIAIKPVFDSLRFMEKTKVVTDDISTTISAQIGSIPVMIGSFSAYSFISIFVNAIVLWTIPFLMILGGIASFCAIALPFVSFIPLYIALPFLLYFENVVYRFGKIPLIHLDQVSVVFWIGYYLLLMGVITAFNKRRKKI